ncbi:MAG: ABC transporter substrate-binding protein [Mycobacteriales bacterium]
MTVRRRRLALIVSIALAVAAGGCTGGDPQSATSGQELKIGLLAPLKGPTGPAGIEAQRGAQLAADVINGLNPSIPLPFAAGAGIPGIGGGRVRIVTADASGPEPQVVAGNTVNQLVSGEGADALVGAYDPEVTEFASQRSERFEVPFVNADSPATFLTEAGRDWFFRLGPSWRSAGEAFLSLLRDKRALGGRMVILHSDDKAGRDVATTVRELAEQAGFDPAQIPDFDFSPTATNLQDVVGRVRASKPDILFLYVTPSTIPPLVQAVASLDFKPKAMLSFSLGYLASKDFQSAIRVVEGLSRSVSWSAEAAERNPAAQAVTALYQRRYNTGMTEAAASAFTAVMTIAQAVDAAGSTQAQRIRTALLSLHIPGEQTVMPWAGIQFDETHQNVLAQTLVEQFVGRSFQVVYPADAASRQLVWPANGSP